MRGNTIKLSIFALVMALIFAALALVFSQYRFGSSESYHAVFSDASGLKSGDKVRIAGVPVGSVTGVGVGDGNLADVDFDVDAKYPLLTSTAATVRYENLVGDRYLELMEGAGGNDELDGGGTIPVEQTSPALDLDLLLGGFKPLLRGLDPQQINDLSAALLHVLQGQGGTLVSLLGSTSSFTNTLADRDQLIGDVITNLNTTLGTIDRQGEQFGTTIDSLQQLVSGLAQDKDPIGDAIPRIDGAAGGLAGLLQATRPDIQSMIAQANRTATQLDLGKDNIDAVLTRLPSDYKKLIRVGSYGSFFQFYLCSNTFKLSGPDGTTLLVPTAKQDTGRCANINGEN
ncbi:MCE family protein [Rhodococcoides kyotonense]|uniref:Phospholipid/cholesterol/gamma-HCH transport system substrate-binding protein n=1 Tax=Rhodococcoides kyotonense TaxID=398843 RepID=A0A239N6F1_9NOCA|nr:MCE family protein [Rhodococcus kyotonensis]SNT50475.1 phospholipid/cholesterol/gamma-HCH transport system substrate-binding protein [Rhodococcus kyotonensis]